MSLHIQQFLINFRGSSSSGEDVHFVGVLGTDIWIVLGNFLQSR